jgi:hypothetical protein
MDIFHHAYEYNQVAGYFQFRMVIEAYITRIQGSESVQHPGKMGNIRPTKNFT